MTKDTNSTITIGSRVMCTGGETIGTVTAELGDVWGWDAPVVAVSWDDGFESLNSVTSLEDIGHEAYAEVFTEIGGGLTIDDLEEFIVEDAKAYAELHELEWPPAPRPEDLPGMTIISWGV